MLIPDEHPVLPWMVEHAAVILNKCEVGKDGKTSHERLKGKKATLLGIEFGEGVLFRRKPGQPKLAKLSSLWEEGIYLGHRAASGESVVGERDRQHVGVTFGHCGEKNITGTKISFVG